MSLTVIGSQTSLNPEPCSALVWFRH